MCWPLLKFRLQHDKNRKLIFALFFALAFATAFPLTLLLCVRACQCVCVRAQHRNLPMFPLSARGGPQPGQGTGHQHQYWPELDVPKRSGGSHRSSGGRCRRDAASEARKFGFAWRAGLVHSGLQLGDPPLCSPAARGEPRAGRTQQAEPGGWCHPVGLEHPGVSKLHDQVRAPAARLSIINGEYIDWSCMLTGEICVARSESLSAESRSVQSSPSYRLMKSRSESDLSQPESDEEGYTLVLTYSLPSLTNWLMVYLYYLVRTERFYKM